VPKMYPWEQKLRAALETRLAGRPLRALAAELAMPESVVTKAIKGERGFGRTTLEHLRQADPLLVAGVFLPPGYALVMEDAGLFLPGAETIVAGNGGDDGQPATEPAD
jgi:hypothetical protein